MSESVLLQEFKYFKQHLDELFQMYPYKILVIKNQQVIGTYNTVDEAINETTKTEELGTFLVQKCDTNPEAYTAYYYSPISVF